MSEAVYLGFDFGYRRIGVAVGQRLTATASPLPVLAAREGVPDWGIIEKLVQHWQPVAFVVGLPTCIDGREQYTTSAARHFARELRRRFAREAHLVDERLTTVEARSRLFEQGGYRKIRKTNVDSHAACLILEQWLQHPS